jgi:hypothetical protein
MLPTVSTNVYTIDMPISQSVYYLHTYPLKRMYLSSCVITRWLFIKFQNFEIVYFPINMIKSIMVSPAMDPCLLYFTPTKLFWTLIPCVEVQVT